MLKKMEGNMAKKTQYIYQILKLELKKILMLTYHI